MAIDRLMMSALGMPDDPSSIADEPTDSYSECRTATARLSPSPIPFAKEFMPLLSTSLAAIAPTMPTRPARVGIDQQQAESATEQVVLYAAQSISYFGWRFRLVFDGWSVNCCTDLARRYGLMIRSHRHQCMTDV